MKIRDPDVIIDIVMKGFRYKVVRRKDDPETYDVLKNNDVKHPKCSAESVMRVLGHYMNDGFGVEDE